MKAFFRILVIGTGLTLIVMAIGVLLLGTQAGSAADIALERSLEYAYETEVTVDRVVFLPGLRGLFGPQTAVVSMINGVPWWYFHGLAGPHQGRGLQCLDPDGRISRLIEPERVIGSVVYPACELVAPGVVLVTIFPQGG